MERHMFFGGNTGGGFMHWFGDILFLDETKKTLFLKGSSGSGKSTLMRKVGAAFEQLGEAVDYIHCSNNVEDLDGICIRSRGIAMVDGTAPHICDPTMPVAIDEIYNTAVYIDPAVAAHADRLRALQLRKKPYFDKAYTYMRAACTVLDNNVYLYSSARRSGPLNRAIEREVGVFALHAVADRPGRNRRMFAAAVTPQGNINFTHTLVEGLTVVALQGCGGMGTDLMLERLRHEANMRGLDTEGLYCPVNPARLDHLIIPALGLCYATVNNYHDTVLSATRTIDFEEFLDRSFLRAGEAELSYNRNLYEELQQRAMDTMAAQKEIHDQIEGIYLEHMDFDGLNRAFDEIMERLKGI